MINLLDSDEEDFVPDEPVNPYDQKTEIEPLVRTRPLDNYKCKLHQKKMYIHLAAQLKKERKLTIIRNNSTNVKKKKILFISLNGNDQ